MPTLELKVASGPKAGKTIVLSSGELVFGRTKVADVVIDWDGSTSSKHFKILKNSDHFVLHDLGSTNGTFVNGNPVTSCPLSEADKILAGSTIFTVHIVNPANAESSVSDSGSGFNPFASVVTAPEERKQASEPPAELKNRQTVDAQVVLRQVRLRIVSLLEKGMVYWLGPGQSLVFGRTAKSDCCLAFDPSLSSRHFSITCHVDRCEIEDLDSRTGTWLNGKRIAKSRVFDGDQLHVGNTDFVIEVEGVDGPVYRSGADAVVGPSAAPTEKPVFEATMSTCASGLVRVRGKLPDVEAVTHIFEALHQQATLYVLIDFARISLPVPDATDIDACKLFKWLPAVAAKKTPLLFVLEELPDWKAYVEEAWGSDALVGIQSQLSPEELLANLQQLLTGSSHGPEAAQGITGFCWPAVLESLLENNQHGFVEKFFAGTSTTLMEVPGDAASWQVYCPEASMKMVKSIGIRLVETEPKEPATPITK